jgi:hypothetical protein
MAEFWQREAVASQKTTWPVLTGVAPEATDAVKDTALPAVTLLEETVSVVTVLDCAQPGSAMPMAKTTTRIATSANLTFLCSIQNIHFPA